MLGLASLISFFSLFFLMFPNFAYSESVPLTNEQGTPLGAMAYDNTLSRHGELRVDDDGRLYFVSCGQPFLLTYDHALITRATHNCTNSLAPWPTDLYAYLADDWSGILHRGKKLKGILHGPKAPKPIVPTPVGCAFCIEKGPFSDAQIDQERLIIDPEKYREGEFRSAFPEGWFDRVDQYKWENLWKDPQKNPWEDLRNNPWPGQLSPTPGQGLQEHFRNNPWSVPHSQDFQQFLK